MGKAQHFTDQLESIEKYLSIHWISHSYIPIEMGPVCFETGGEVVNFTLIHEGIILRRAGERKTLLFFAAET
ncbi:hypothetical protein P9578_06825 [Brevibacillus choshinensis]|uniref:hypothetical protein n=1 Tax=Brevibacillus choshinensis TaxID=54911 RepID=UPI002E1C2FC2|nr:hypothetical protein [Brevibacillus choshinensis]